MTDRAVYFEVQRLITEGDTTGHWQTVEGDQGRTSHAGALDLRGTYADLNPGETFRVVPFGTGPVDFEPGETMPGTPDHERRAWDMVAARVRALGGCTDDIVRFGSGFRYYTGAQPAGGLADAPVETIIGAGWETGTVTAQGFTTDPAATDVTAGGGC